MRRNQQTRKINAVVLLVFLFVSPCFLGVPTSSSPIPDWDVNSDGACNLSDIVQISFHIGEVGIAGWICEDVDNNGIIQVFDMVIVSNHFQESGWVVDMKQIKTWTACYSSVIFDAWYQQFIADHFDILDCVRDWHDVPAAAIKALNPDICIVGYYDALFMPTYVLDWEYVNQFEDWFVHDTNGERIMYGTYETYMMDPHSSWSDYYAQQSQEFLQSHPQYDGIFADDVLMDMDLCRSWICPDAGFEEGVLDNWETWMMQHMQNLQTTVGEKKILPNAWKWPEVCEDITGMHCWEDFVHSYSQNMTHPGYSEEFTLFSIDTLHELAVQGDIISVLSGVKDADSNPTLAHHVMLYTLACFLFAVEDMEKSYYSWNAVQTDASHGWYPEMDYEFGEPLGEYYNIQGSVYARQFENATIVANLAPSTTYTIVIDGASYEIGSKTGVIIQ